RRMRQTYSERIEVLRDAAKKYLSGRLEVTEAVAGMRAVAWLDHRRSDHAAAQRAQSLGLELVPLSAFTIEHAQNPALILGFAGCNPSELRRGVSVLAAALE